MDDLTPKLHELRFLKKMLPQLKRQAQSKGKKLYVRNGMIDPVPCVICGYTFDRYNSGKEKHENCPACRKKLESGQTCLLCKVDKSGLYDGRYAWLAGNDHPAARQMAGKVIGVDAQTMDSIVLKEKLAELPDGDVIQICPKCKKEEQLKREVDEPPETALVTWPCESCIIAGATQGVPEYFDANMNPINPK
jgi:rubredoxin